MNSIVKAAKDLIAQIDVSDFRDAGVILKSILSEWNLPQKRTGTANWIFLIWKTDFLLVQF